MKSNDNPTGILVVPVPTLKICVQQRCVIDLSERWFFVAENLRSN